MHPTNWTKKRYVSSLPPAISLAQIPIGKMRRYCHRERSIRLTTKATGWIVNRGSNGTISRGKFRLSRQFQNLQNCSTQYVPSRQEIGQCYCPCQADSTAVPKRWPTP